MQRKLMKIAQKLASQIHLRSLRETFVTILPFIILAGIAVLFNNVILGDTGILSRFISKDSMAQAQGIGNSIINGTLNIVSILIVFTLAYMLAKNKKFDTPIYPGLISISVLIIFMPLMHNIVPNGAKKAVEIGGVLPFQLTNTAGTFVSIFTAIFTTELFIKLSTLEKMKIKMNENVPPAVEKTFNLLIPVMLTMIIFALVSFGINTLTGEGIHKLIAKLIQAPLLGFTTSLPGFLFLMFIFNLLFAFGIHPSGIVGPILDPAMLIAMQGNMLAYSNGTTPPHIINTSFQNMYGLMGGTGNSLALIIAILVFSKKKQYRDIAKLALPTGIFNINEPIIFGLPIVFNPILMIPFVLTTVASLLVAYLATAMGLVSKAIALVPWTTPPIISQYLSTGGDLRSVILGILLLGMSVLIYLPFLKISDRVAEQEGNA